MPTTPPILAALSFSDPLMLAGLLAAAIPLALHLLNRIRSPIVPFPTRRFRKITAQKTSRRRQVQQYFLLVLRMAVFAMIAMAVAHPLIRGGTPTLAYAFLAMMLVGIAFLVLATISATTAFDKSKSRPSPSTAETSQSPPAARPTKHLALSALALLLAIAFTGFSVFGLTSNTFFSGDAGIFSGRSTAAVILFDNSHSMLAKREGITRLDAARKEIRRMLVETLHPAEAAILATNPPPSPTGETLTTDMTALVGYLDHLQPAGRARPMKERLRTAADLLARSTDGNKMLILVSDLAGPAFADADLFAPLKESGMHDVQIVVMPPGGTAPLEDVGIASFALAEGSGAAVLGSDITLEAQLLNSGDTAAAKEWELLIDGQPAGNTDANLSTIQLNPAGAAAGRATIRIPYRLDQAGAHAFTLHLKNAADAMEWDDARTIVLDVADQAKVLVIGADPTSRGPRPRSAAFFFQAALAPFEGGATKDAAGKPISWAIKPEYRSIDDITSPAQLAGNSAIFICDVPRIPPRTADALQKYVTTGDGGRLIWILGPSVDSANYNNTLLPRGLLPASLKDPLVSAAGTTLDWVDLQSDIFTSLFDGQEPFRAAVITGRWSLTSTPADEVHARTLAKLSDSTPLLTEHAGPGNVGEIYTLLTSPGAAWSNLGSTVLMVPLASRMALGDSGRSKTPLSYDAGDTALLRIPAAESLPPAALATLTLDITTPANAVINVRPAITTTRWPTWPFVQTQTDGLYHWRSVDGKHTGLFAVNPPAEEVDLHSANAEELAREAGLAASATPGHAPIVATSADDLLAQLDKRSEGTSLTPGVLAMVMILAVIEALMANRYRPAAPIESPSLPRPAPIEPAAAA